MQIYNQNRVMPDIRSVTRNVQTQNTVNDGDNSFNSILNKKILFSKHAAERLNNRSISMTEEQIERVENGIDKARQKGIRDSLVLVDNLALVVNVKNRTVITAMDEKSRNENVFTNIDGAVIV